MQPPLLRHLGLGLALAAVAADARAHHSYAEYDDARMVEIEGTLLRAAMQNPHVHFAVEGLDANGRAVTWDLEITSLNWLQRLQVPPEMFRVGSRVKFAGWPSKRSPSRVYALNMLAEDGQEILLFRTAKARWRDTTLGFGSEQAQSFYRDGVASDSASLFRVWASVQADPTMAFRPTAPLALTESARKAVAALDPLDDPTIEGCTPKGMPRVMSQPPPMELVDRGHFIQLRLEEYDMTRTFHLADAADPATQPRTLLGYSVGRWDGTTLVVETTRVSAPYLNAAGVPIGSNARFVERFTPAADGSRLEYTLDVTDPDSLTAPAQFRRTWVWRPGEQVLPFNCQQ
ncbi:MAG TPA: DUF6152 family protein [Gammaproteobacteria bacterium]|nr:DUF6152 family protein [Gammaproteobacteria bacterium]